MRKQAYVKGQVDIVMNNLRDLSLPMLKTWYRSSTPRHMDVSDDKMPDPDLSFQSVAVIVQRYTRARGPRRNLAILPGRDSLQLVSTDPNLAELHRP